VTNFVGPAFLRLGGFCGQLGGGWVVVPFGCLFLGHFEICVVFWGVGDGFPLWLIQVRFGGGVVFENWCCGKETPGGGVQNGGVFQPRGGWCGGLWVLVSFLVRGFFLGGGDVVFWEEGVVFGRGGNLNYVGWGGGLPPFFCF